MDSGLEEKELAGALEELTVVAADGMDESLLGTPGMVDLSSLKGEKKIQAIVDTFRAAAGGILIVRSATVVDRALMDQLPNLRGIIRGGHGLDNVDVEYAESKGIRVRGTKGSEMAVAGLTGWMMARAHAIAMETPVPDQNEAPPKLLGILEWEAAYQEKAGKEPADFQPVLRKKFEELFQPIAQSTLAKLQGKTLGVIGFGAIGRAIASTGRGLGMPVLAYAPSLAANPSPAEAMGVQFVPREEIERTAHYVVLATGLYKTGPRKNVGMVDAAAVDRMLQNPNLIALINPDREGLVLEEEIVRLMQEGKQYLADEVPKHPYLLEHALFTPHIAASASSAKQQVAANTAAVLEEMREEIQHSATGLEERVPGWLEPALGADWMEVVYGVHEIAQVTDKIAVLIQPELLGVAGDDGETQVALMSMEGNLHGAFGWPEQTKLRLGLLTPQSLETFEGKGYRVIQVMRHSESEETPLPWGAVPIVVAEALADGRFTFWVNVTPYLNLKGITLPEILSTLTDLFA